MINIYYYKTEDISAPFTEKEKRLFPLLSPLKKDRIETSSSAEVRKMSFYGEILALGIGLSEYGLGTLPRIEYAPKGKPFFGDGSLRFNISHTDGCVFIAFSEREVGVDAEIKRPFSRRVAARCFSEKELAFLEDASDKDTAFTRIWTGKEACVKYTGEGIGYGDMKNVSSFDPQIVTLSAEDKYTVSVFPVEKGEDVLLKKITDTDLDKILTCLEGAVYDGK